MGLSGRRGKQRIPADPRNLCWADDTAKFGHSYLSKLGWHPSQGLGVSGEGRTSHIKVSQKLDMLGIGAAHQREPNGIAWKQNKEFEDVLKRLNESVDIQASEEEGQYEMKSEDGIDGCKRVRRMSVEVDKDDKRKRNRKRSKDERLAETKRKRDKNAAVGVNLIPAKNCRPPIRAHRARVIASKSLTSKSAIAVAEILGIAPTMQTSLTPSSRMVTDQDRLDKITTSTKSVSDYFMDKLSSKPTFMSTSSWRDPTSWEGSSRRGLGAA